MARIEGEILIGRPAEEVFDFVADSRNEPSFNPAMTGVELLTPLPIGVGTRFRARMGRAGTQMLVELTEFDRPHRLGSRTTSSMMQTSGALTFAAHGAVRVSGQQPSCRGTGRVYLLYAPGCPAEVNMTRGVLPRHAVQRSAHIWRLWRIPAQGGVQLQGQSCGHGDEVRWSERLFRAGASTWSRFCVPCGHPVARTAGRASASSPSGAPASPSP